MKRYDVELREEAIADLVEIYAFIVEKSRAHEIAIRFIGRIKKR